MLLIVFINNAVRCFAKPVSCDKPKPKTLKLLQTKPAPMSKISPAKIWAEGKYLDFWSFQHFLSGCLLAGAFVFLNIPFWLGFTISFLLMALWEVFEFFRGVQEWPGNKTMDIVTGLFGFVVMTWLMRIEVVNNYILFLAALALFAFLAIWGFSAYNGKIKS